MEIVIIRVGQLIYKEPIMAKAARGSRGSSITKPISTGSKVTTGGKFDRPSDPGDTGIIVDSNRESGPRLNPRKRG